MVKKEDIITFWVLLLFTILALALSYALYMESKNQNLVIQSSIIDSKSFTECFENGININCSLIKKW